MTLTSLEFIQILLVSFFIGYWIGHWTGKAKGIYEAIKLSKKLDAEFQEKRGLK